MTSLFELFKNPWLYGVGPVFGIFGCWLINHFFPSFVKFSFDIKLENHRRTILRKDKTSIISDLVVLLHRGPKSETEFDTVNKHIFDLCLYLPPCLIHKMAHTVCKTEDKQNIGIYQLLVSIREFIDGTYKADSTVKLDGGNIPHLTYAASNKAHSPN